MINLHNPSQPEPHPIQPPPTMNTFNEIKRLIDLSNRDFLDQFIEYVKGRIPRDNEVILRDLVREYTTVNKKRKTEPMDIDVVSEEEEEEDVTMLDDDEEDSDDDVYVPEEELEDDALYYVGDPPNDL
jgi:hypothetical protein